MTKKFLNAWEISSTYSLLAININISLLAINIIYICKLMILLIPKYIMTLPGYIANYVLTIFASCDNSNKTKIEFQKKETELVRQNWIRLTNTEEITNQSIAWKFCWN